ncbi:zinc-responsive transcriptional regulator [Vibrio sp. UCD-FRSSP16_10]|uniref:Zn(2+)-responsive transcriptional regulator n=1 Tax=unclassified Vibrio TaxID=2614977 RepID=UPI000800A189|nr:MULTISPECIES: Zn(2+)-responsive transcriptional regulator [unclassified Vibrio]OBT16452.1 zinc-responsive transcriptional regulator [Vibrio sp. UCD-FRSSP16_30]OBT21317.1 zinc-responsive transcriptional regulator [Vibrio sp. UCD-FRSSP16_10]
MYRIGELAKQFNLKPDTLRFYEKHGLLKATSRSAGGYRVYTDKDVDKLGFIIRAKKVGFTLTEIEDLLSIQIARDDYSCHEAKEIVDIKLAQVEEKIRELQVFQSSLTKLSASCCGGDEPATHCSILEALDSADCDVREEAK